MMHKKYWLEQYHIKRCEKHNSPEQCLDKKMDCSDCIYRISWELVEF